MNYRHAYHAGNFSDCFKHALLLALLDSLAIKPAPFFVMDTHAGAGRYDLNSEAARLTGEADLGIRRLLKVRPSALERYLRLIVELGLYPGSPTIIRAALRPHDRLACCEMLSEEVAALQRQFNLDKQVAVHHRSGWQAMVALLPPREKRGLVFIDPPFECQEEFFRLAKCLSRGRERFNQGIFAAWYPIKQMAAVRNFKASLAASGIRDIVAVEINVRETATPNRLNGCGLIVINPPYNFEVRALGIAAAVLDAVSDDERGTRATVTRLADD